MQVYRFSKVLLPVLIIFNLLFMPSTTTNAQSNKTNHPKIEETTAYITSFKKTNGKWVGKFDYIQWYFGKDADKEFLKDCNCSKEMDHAPDGYYIRNVNPKIRTFTISNSATYILQTFNPYEIKWNQKVTRAQFVSFLKDRNQHHYIPFHIEIQNGIVTKITEQYIP
ncbi:hypothetical protein HPT25_22520 [Bacillus sp. BRMEA1]|uniref:hypothetical protein n=1 Tax=Neobacillus endophyticus TaxID=2738405 RepID=UPI0015657CC1|nr:hypothetical protein [Neobacillus endophyticus]NRD80117.1 hypothetical protein [Neobacillus endophyticus]